MPLPPLGRNRSGRHRPPEPEQPAAAAAEAEAPDTELESYLAALAPEGDPETTGSGRRFGGSQVYQLRLPLMANEELREIARHYGTSPLSLAQDWVMQRLRWEHDQLTGR